MKKSSKLGYPNLPTSCPRVRTDEMTLIETIKYMKTLPENVSIRDDVRSLIYGQPHKHDLKGPLAGIRMILDSMRAIPRSDERMISMKTFLRTLGDPETFAMFLDIIREASLKIGTPEYQLTEASRRSSKHAVYGWCGQTRLSLSGEAVLKSTIIPEDGVQAYLGKTPTSAWSLSMHVWQPNPSAKGFLCGYTADSNIIAEPPHSHPFDFMSIVVAGQMHQSIYRQSDLFVEKTDKEMQARDRYDGITLQHVHGVWPPHGYQEENFLITLEDRVKINVGDIYFMSGDVVHDVQIDQNIAQRTPAITLFLRSETYTKPHVYMASSMADFHSANPDLKNHGYPLSEQAWFKKLGMVADYVRGRSPILNLDEVVKYENEYAFFHR